LCGDEEAKKPQLNIVGRTPSAQKFPSTQLRNPEHFDIYGTCETLITLIKLRFVIPNNHLTCSRTRDMLTRGAAKLPTFLRLIFVPATTLPRCTLDIFYHAHQYTLSLLMTAVTSSRFVPWYLQQLIHRLPSETGRQRTCN
jgi:hypothetical protein